ncbi:methylated-DNA--[protein]-cysteine S-methyltransferase [Actinoplanes sp. NPDC051411]|uniref:methylated-DNA--[protein]-cysteine S-methyltransferase n=1 Tax=Actinoplanes sp. NPDC051411 TaxID=3155522 RepID=UPI00342969D1
MVTLAPAGTRRHAVIDSPVGPLTLVRDERGITGLYFPHHWTKPDPAGFGPRVDPSDDPGFADVITQLGEYFAGTRQTFDLPLAPDGSDTERELWGLLGEIPYGRTTTYAALAQQMSGPVSPLEAGKMVGRNPLSILVACHRVVGAGGKLAGYAGGLPRKRYLLDLEHTHDEHSTDPGLW